MRIRKSDIFKDHSLHQTVHTPIQRATFNLQLKNALDPMKQMFLPKPKPMK